METKMKTAIYSRVSTDKQDAVNQLNGLRKLVADMGWELVIEFVDTATGGNSDREAFQRMFEAAERGEFQKVVFWSLDRLTREGTLETLQHLKRLELAGVGYKSMQETELDTDNPYKDVFISLRATQAKLEKQRISERTKAGLATARSRGVVLGNRPVAVDLAELRRLRAGGLTVRKIADVLGVSKSTISTRLQAVAA
jgi:DNA invertase Pin-like site-specific DNA recombinase